jgi:hypothetical protein
MIKFFRRLFPKYKVMHRSFHTGTFGMSNHKIFIEEVNKYNVQIINSFITYHRDFKDNHLPQYINYVVKYKL